MAEAGGAGGEELGPAAAYSALVAEWLNQAYHAHMIQVGFSSFLAQQAASFAPGGNSWGTAAASIAAGPAAAAAPSHAPQQPPPPPQPAPSPQGQAAAAASGPAESFPVVYTVPPVWKRLVAEVLDFLILFTLKIMITFTAVDFFQVLDLENYDLDIFNLANTEGIDMEAIDYDTALQFTSEILVLELIHRLVVCVFEALCTHRGPPGMQGGATPGKVIMGLKIVKCDQVIGLGGSRVGVTTGGNLGLGWALLRSVLKNFALAFFFPVCFSLMFLPFSRTLYDIMARSIVVESNYNRINRVQQQQQQQQQQ